MFNNILKKYTKKLTSLLETAFAPFLLGYSRLCHMLFYLIEKVYAISVTESKCRKQDGYSEHKDITDFKIIKYL